MVPVHGMWGHKTKLIVAFRVSHGTAMFLMYQDESPETEQTTITAGDLNCFFNQISKQNLKRVILILYIIAFVPVL